ncbi:MAG: hypothetical protein PUA75_09550, partial [Clostridiales bacterium]|nr:hypothetical protein [Clostridiales bacterium]
MQKQKIQFLVLLAVVLLLGGIYAGIRYYNETQEKKEEEEQAAETVSVTDMKVSDITGFSYVLEGETISFTKEGDDWQYDGDRSLDMDEDAIETMLSKAVGVTAEETVTDYE